MINIINKDEYVQCSEAITVITGRQDIHSTDAHCIEESSSKIWNIYLKYSPGTLRFPRNSDGRVEWSTDGQFELYRVASLLEKLLFRWARYIIPAWSMSNSSGCEMGGKQMDPLFCSNFQKKMSNFLVKKIY